MFGKKQRIQGNKNIQQNPKIIVIIVIEFIIRNFDTLAVGLLLTAFGGYVAYRNYRKNRFADVCIKFRNEVTTALEGIYPTISVYIPPDEINTKILQSIPKIITAATAYRHHLPSHRKSGFDRTTQNYSDTARNTDWNRHIAHLMYPSMQKPGDISPGDKFKHAVDNLLYICKRKLSLLSFVWVNFHNNSFSIA